MRSTAPSLLLFTLAISFLNVQAAQIPPFYADAVVAIGRYETRPAGQPGGWITEASGFL